MAEIQAIQFTHQGVSVTVTPENKDKIIKLLDTMATVPSGKRALKNLSRYKTQVYMTESLGATTCGYYMDSQNKIALSASLGEDSLISTFTHEARHAEQYHDNGARAAQNSTLNARSRLLLERCMEADAQCAALEVCNQLAVRKNKAPLQVFSTKYPEIADAYKKEHSYSDAFKGWFDQTGVMSLYEAGYIGETAVRSVRFKSVKSEYENLSAKKMEEICGEYCDDFKDFIQNDKRAKTIQPITRAFLELRNAADVAKGSESDNSIRGLPVRTAGGNEGGMQERIGQDLKRYIGRKQYDDMHNSMMYTAFDRAADMLIADAKTSENATKTYDSKRSRIFMYMATCLERGVSADILNLCPDLHPDDKQFFKLKTRSYGSGANTSKLSEEEKVLHRRNLNRIAGEMKIDSAFLQKAAATRNEHS